MKVLFAVNNDDISEAILKKYQRNYKEILSYKNVYYFNAILKELQKDKTYDRIVISEDLEPFANNNYDAIDRFLFEKLDNISDETTNAEGNNIDIIFICSDRRNKSDAMLSKLYNIGIYSAIIGQDRSTGEVCRLINSPRTKKEAKQYYNIEVDSANYQSDSEDTVSEVEVQNILAHYKRLGKNEEKYVDSFNNIVSQYNDAQLKIIIRYLPISVKAVLEEKSPKYQQLASFSSDNTNTTYQRNKKVEPIQIEMINKQSDKNKITKPIVIPSGVNKNQVTKLIKPQKLQEEKDERNNESIRKNDELDFSELDAILDNEVDPNKLNENIDDSQPKRGRGRPKKVMSNEEVQENKPKRGRGRPKKNLELEQTDKEDELVDLFNLDNQEKVEQKTLEQQDDSINLFELDNEETSKKQTSDEEQIDLFDLVGEEKDIEIESEQSIDNKELNDDNNLNTEITQTEYVPNINNNLNTILTKDKKVVCFVGTTKNGTSFIVNNVAHLLASMEIPTAILDMTKTRNAYYIYTNSEEQLMKTARDSINKLKSGIADGVKVNKNLTVYTSLPEDENEYTDVDNILSTLVKNYSVVLIDCDFDTPMEYFDAAQEIYLVQSMDVLTIQPLTAFLRNVQSRGILKQEKLKIVINKSVNIKSVSIKTLIGGISNYNDPSMTYMKNLFDKDKIPYCVIPFETQNYIKYLDALITCNISLNGYTTAFISALKQLCNMIYPLINKQTYSPRGDKYKNNFSSDMNDTLKKMKRRYN